MKLKRLSLHGRETQGSRGLAEPSEARFRAWLLALVLVLGPPLLLFFYYKTMFLGLINPDALDFAQLGRAANQERLSGQRMNFFFQHCSCFGKFARKSR